MERKIILSSEELSAITKKIGKTLTEDLKHEDTLPIFVCVMKGAINFFMDVIRNVDLPILTDYIQVSSYEGTGSTGKVNLKKDIAYDIKDRNVIIIEDIVDTGYTMKYLKDMLYKREPKSISICALIDKPKAHKVDIDVDYVGYVTDANDFLLGYGLDYNELCRNAPYIYAATKEEVEYLDALLLKQ